MRRGRKQERRTRRRNLQTRSELDAEQTKMRTATARSGRRKTTGGAHMTRRGVNATAPGGADETTDWKRRRRRWRRGDEKQTGKEMTDGRGRETEGGRERGSERGRERMRQRERGRGSARSSGREKGRGIGRGTKRGIKRTETGTEREMRGEGDKSSSREQQ